MKTQKPFVDTTFLREQRQEEHKIYGVNACLAAFEHRPKSIVCLWILATMTGRFQKTLKWLATYKKAYHIVNADELDKIAGTKHHGGVCFLMKKQPPLTLAHYLQNTPRRAQECLLALETVGNPHNLGGILRSCAHFGVSAILLSKHQAFESGAVARTAAGGIEHIELIAVDEWANSFRQLQHAGFSIITTSSHQGTPLWQLPLPAKSVFVLGEESQGLAPKIWQQGNIKLAITGTGKVESLNLSVATGILLAQWWQQNRPL